MAAQDASSKAGEKVQCVCPFCEQAMDPSAPWCATCEVEVRFCVSCEEPLPRDATECPNCGTECSE
jgi:hypothetical protein